MKKQLEKNNYHHGNLKSELIQKGLKILDKEGYDSFSLRKVAKACLVTPTAPYRHFKNKDELIAAIALEASRKFDDVLQKAVEKFPDDPRKQLREMGCNYVEFFVKNPEYLRLIFLSDIAQKMKFEEIVLANCTSDHDRTGKPFETFYKTVERYKNQYHSKKSTAMTLRELILYCWGLVHGIAILISRKDFQYEGDPMEIVRKIMWNENFLN